MKKMKHFLPEIDDATNLCMVDWYGFSNALNLRNEKGLRTRLNVNDGISIASQWPADARIQITGKLKKRGAMLGNEENVLMVNQELKMLIVETCTDVAIEFLPFSVVDKKGKVIGENYYLVNPLGTYDALDLSASDIHWASDGSILYIREIVLNKKKAAKAPSIFRLQQAPKKILIGYSLAYAISEHEIDIWCTEMTYGEETGTELPEEVTEEQLSIAMQLVIAARNGKANMVAALLAKQPLLNLFDNPEYGSTALMYAAKRGDHNMLKQLIAAGAAVDTADSENRTALYFAVQENKPFCVKELLQAGANPNIGRTEHGKSQKIIGSPLETAVFLNLNKIVQFLLSHNADPNLKDHNGKLPFHEAKNEEMYRLLVEAGTDINTTGKYFYPPFHTIAGQASLGLLQVATGRGGKINSTDGYNNSTPLMAAAANGKLENLKYLLSQNANMELKDNNGKTAIQYAFENKHYAIVEYLSSIGATATESIRKRTKEMQKERPEFAFDLYAQEIAAVISGIIDKKRNEVQFEPTVVQINFDKDWQLEWFTISGKTEQELFQYHISSEDQIPAGYDQVIRKKLFKPFLDKYKLKEKSISPVPMLPWQLFKAIHELSVFSGFEKASLSLVHDNHNSYTGSSSIQNTLLTNLLPIWEQPEPEQSYARICLHQQTEQQAFLQILNTAPRSYAIDSFTTFIIQSAVAQITEQKASITHPVSGLALQYADSGSLLPSGIILQFQKGAAKSWTLEWPETSIPMHVDEIHDNDYLLPAFIKTHALKGTILEWSDIYQLPAPLLRLELLLAGQQIMQLLHEQGITFTSKAKACISDGEDDNSDVNYYTELVRKQIRNKFPNDLLLKAFSSLCYQTEEKQQWLQRLK